MEHYSVRNPAHHGTPDITIGAVGSYPAFSPLSRTERCSIRDSFFSVALSVSLFWGPRVLPGTFVHGVRTFLSSGITARKQTPEQQLPNLTYLNTIFLLNLLYILLITLLSKY
jgi:hypothetical protein